MTDQPAEAAKLSGSCHCGAIRARLVATKAAAQLQVRACQCGFCTRHGAMTVSDPEGRAVFEIERAALSKYLFETRTGTSLVCARCGMYAGVILEDEGKIWSAINVRGLAIPEFKGRAAEPVVYEGLQAGASRAASRSGRRRRSCGDDSCVGSSVSDDPTQPSVQTHVGSAPAFAGVDPTYVKRMRCRQKS